MVDRPTGPFWDASHHTPAQKDQLKTPLELNPERDKDNAEPRPKPSYARNRHPQLAPGGTLGTKRGLASSNKPSAERATTSPDRPKDQAAKAFAPIVPRSPDPDHGHER
jgi:hypothetical protein